MTSITYLVSLNPVYDGYGNWIGGDLTEAKHEFQDNTEYDRECIADYLNGLAECSNIKLDSILVNGKKVQFSSNVTQH